MCVDTSTLQEHYTAINLNACQATDGAIQNTE